jgi:hypothetical protein
MPTGDRGVWRHGGQKLPATRGEMVNKGGLKRVLAGGRAGTARPVGPGTATRLRMDTKPDFRTGLTHVWFASICIPEVRWRGDSRNHFDLPGAAGLGHMVLPTSLGGDQVYDKTMRRGAGRTRRALLAVY